MTRVFTIYVCPNCDAVEVEPSASQHGCRPKCGMWVRTRVIEMAAWERLDHEYQRLLFVKESLVDRAMRWKPSEYAPAPTLGRDDREESPVGRLFVKREETE